MTPRPRNELRNQGRTTALFMVPLVIAACYHLVRGDVGSWWGWGFAGAVACLGVLLDVGSRRWRARWHRDQRALGHDVWRATVPIIEFERTQEHLPWWSWLRDVVPVDITLDDGGLHVRAVRRYARYGFQPLELRWSQVRHIKSRNIGHVRPDGSISTANVFAIDVTLHDGQTLPVILDEPPNDFLQCVGKHRAAAR